MGSNPVNLAIRFLLELFSLTAMGIWGWQLDEGWIRFILVWAIPVLAAAFWGIFAVPGDPSRSGAAPFPVPGILRLIMELTFFAFATWILNDLGYHRLSLAMGIVVIIHYLVSWDRLIWLLKQH